MCEFGVGIAEWSPDFLLCPNESIQRIFTGNVYTLIMIYQNYGVQGDYFVIQMINLKRIFANAAGGFTFGSGDSIEWVIPCKDFDPEWSKSKATLKNREDYYA